MRIGLCLLVVALAALESGCCRWCTRPCPPPTAARCYQCAERAEVAVVRTCLQGCTTSACQSGCCHKLAFVEGTEEERAALRSCIRECAPPVP